MSEQHILLTTDIVVFTVRQGELHVLLIERKNPPFKGEYALPGGFVEEKESLEEAALRELEEETGVRDVFIKKLTAYGDIGRDPRGRVVTVAFMALIDSTKFSLQATEDALRAEWAPVNEIEQLAFDHLTILTDALFEMRLEIQTTNVAVQLLPEKFTLSELQALYESILGKPLDKRNFRKRVKAFGIVRETTEMKREGAHRPATLYRFRQREYKTLRDRIQVFL